MNARAIIEAESPKAAFNSFKRDPRDLLLAQLQKAIDKYQDQDDYGILLDARHWILNRPRGLVSGLTWFEFLRMLSDPPFAPPDSEVPKLLRAAAEQIEKDYAISEAESPKAFFRELNSKPGSVKTIMIYGRRWFNRSCGNTYHTAYIQVNDQTVHQMPFQYGYGDQYVWNAWQWLDREGWVTPEHHSNGSIESPWAYAARMGIKVGYEAMDVKRRKDL